MTLLAIAITAAITAVLCLLHYEPKLIDADDMLLAQRRRIEALQAKVDALERKPQPKPHAPTNRTAAFFRDNP